jgi:tRNA A37 methylthiotransferase MiaB
MARYHIETYGCTSNRGESRRIEAALRDGGHRPAASPSAADVAILNTCTVVEKTERNMLARAEELQSETADLIVTGCMALAQARAFEAAGVDARVLHWDDVPTAVRNGECPTLTDGVDPVLDGVVGILPIARGCMSDCSYCITKQATGRIDSPPVAENVEKARALVHAGAEELRITGQDTGVYGWDDGERKLPELLDRICAIDGDFRRQHQVSEFREVVATFDAHLEEWTLSTDFIVGFPTETEADFERSMDLIREVRPEKINVTRFSKRPGTDAADLTGLGGQTKKDRSKAMTELKMDVVAEAYESLIGERRDVLVVQEGTGDSVKCRDDAYRQIVVQNADEHGVEPGDRLAVEVTGHSTVYAFGRPV